MSKFKLYQLKDIKQCSFKAYISQFGFKTATNKSAMIRKLYKSIIQEYDFRKLNEQKLKDIILDKLEDTYFLTQQEKEVELVTILNYLSRYVEYERQLDRKILSKKIYGNVQIDETEIDLNADIVFENNDNIELVKYKVGATELSYKARTDKNLPENNIELFLLKKLGEKIYSKFNKPVIASFYHFKGKSEDKDVYKQFLQDKELLISESVNLQLKSSMCTDKKEKKAIDKEIKNINDVLYFNNSIGNNIITYDYSKDLSEEVLKLANTELSYDSELCPSADCEFCNYSTLCRHKISYVQNELEEVIEVEKSKGEVKLTENQKEIVNIEKGVYRINACAGSGKSSTMVLRIIELFKKGYKPSDILMITFTNKGSQELKEKIIYWLNYYKIKGINFNDLNIFTFNGFGEEIVSKEWERLGFTQKPQLATTVSINDVIKELLEEHDKIEWLNYKNPLMNYPHAKGAFKQLLLYFNLIKSFNYNKDNFITNVLIKKKNSENIDLNAKQDMIFQLYDEFNSKLKSKNLLQYQDQVLYLIELFKTYPEMINTYSYKHIVVDEYQDTNFTQVELVKLLKTHKDFASLIVVGDNSQNIYGFNCATQENILKFHEVFENVQDIFLLDNFRSTPQICNVANNLDKINTQRIDKDIISRKADGEIPKLLQFDKLDDENNYIVELINEKIKAGVPKHEICYIARTKKELLTLQKFLQEKDIDNVIEASELYINNPNVQTILNLANFFRNMEQDYYLMEYMAVTDKEFSKASIEDSIQIIENIKSKIINEFEEIKEQDNKENLKIQYFNNMITPILESDVIAKSFMENINAKTFYTFNELLSHLYKIVLYEDDSSIEKDESKYEAVVLTTSHSSKGKEWSVVINSINSYKYDESNLEALEEERRLLFVSLTRAKDELYICYNTHQDKTRGKGDYCLFADELIGVERI